MFSSNLLGSSLSILIGEDNEPVHVGVAKELPHDGALKPGGYNNHMYRGYWGLVIASLEPRFHLEGGLGLRLVGCLVTTTQWFLSNG